MLLDRYRPLGLTLPLAGALAVLACGEDPTPPPTTGTVQITTTTSGVEQDPDGYSVQIGSGAAQAIGNTATLTSEDIDPGTYPVQLTGMAANCTVEGESPRSVTVTAGETTTVAFVITCSESTGSLSIVPATSGWPADPDGYTVAVDGVDRGTVGPGGSVTIDEVATGDHAVSLSGVAANCRVLGTNPRTVTVPPGEALSVSFAVSCNAVSGSMTVRAVTTGPAPDEDGYIISLDGDDRGTLGVNASVTLSGLVPGTHLLGLGGIAANCEIDGANLQTVTVGPGNSPDITYTIACVTPPAASGTLRITAVTADPDPETEGYTLIVDGGAAQPIGVNATYIVTNLAVGAHAVRLGGVPDNCTLDPASPTSVTIGDGTLTELTFTVTCRTTTGDVLVRATTSGATPDANGYVATLNDATPGQPIATGGTVRFSGVPAGPHTVALSDVADGCSVTGGPSRDVTVTAGAVVEAAFAVTCAGATGTIEATAATSGTSPDPDGYALSVDGGTPQPLTPDAPLTIPNLAPGDHAVELTGVAANCTVGDNPRTVAVTADATVPVAFAVTCSTVLGSLQVTTTTSGSSPDPDGYSLSVDGGAPVTVGPSATVPVEGLLVGPHTVTLSGAASNCHVTGENPRSVTVVEGSTPVAFEINCLGSDALVAFFSNALGLGAIFVVSPNGTGLRNLTPAGSFEFGPVWSPDGRRLLFAQNEDLWVMDAQGGGRVKLADGQFGIGGHTWSRDGRMIAYVDGRPEGENIVSELWVMNSDGSGKLRLAEDASQPSWSPEGRRLAYFGGGVIRVINVDGTGDVALSSQPAFQPAWSPDGNRIAFVTLSVKQMTLINPDGTGEVALTPAGTQDDSPTWSPDGSRIAFNTGSQESDVAVMNADGSGRVNLTNQPGFDFGPSWSPDGSRLVYHREEADFSDSEIYVMNADGTNQTNLSNRPNTRESSPAWGGEARQLLASRASRASSVYSRWLKAQGSRAWRMP